MTSPETEIVYVAPKLEVVGTVYELTTDLQDKKLGPTDGLTFMGIPIANASP
jgi:hypothetical protein